MVDEGDQPFYAARHVGMTGSGGTNEIIAYGIGRKLAGGQTISAWVLPNGMICLSQDDMDRVGVMMVRALGPRQA